MQSTLNMFKHQQQKYMQHSPEFLFSIVTDIEKYPQFLPWCKAARIKSNENNVIIADLIVGKGPLKEKFTSKVTLNNKNLSIITEYIDGPMEFMKSQWQFYPIHDNSNINSNVEFNVEFSFKSNFLNQIFKEFFQNTTTKIVQAFENRAQQLKHN